MIIHKKNSTNSYKFCSSGNNYLRFLLAWLICSILFTVGKHTQHRCTPALAKSSIYIDEDDGNWKKKSKCVPAIYLKCITGTNFDSLIEMGTTTLEEHNYKFIRTADNILGPLIETKKNIVLYHVHQLKSVIITRICRNIKYEQWLKHVSPLSSLIINPPMNTINDK